MSFSAWGYFLFGLTLTILFIFIIKHYYTKSRKDEIEEAKFRMLKDDDEE
jgi:cbb3-type cytochrome oxidase subunit 3